MIHPGIGSFIKAAFLENNEIIDHALYYSPVESKEEGYYLVGISKFKINNKGFKIEREPIWTW